MTGSQLASDLIQRLVADVAAHGKKNGAVLGVQFFDGGASARRIAFAEELLQIAQQQCSMMSDMIPFLSDGVRD